MTVSEMAVADIERAAKHLNPLVIHTADWQRSADPVQRAMFTAAHNLIGTLGSIQISVGMLIDEVAQLRSALERTEANFVAAVNGYPVRDMAENLAENRAALGGVSR